MCHMSRVRCHMSHFTLSQTVRARDLQFSHNITLCVQCHMSHFRCHLSGVTCQVSHVTCHVSCVMCHVLCVICNIFFTKWLSWLVEALLSTGPTPSSFQIFFLLKRFDTQYLLSRLVVFRFGSLKKQIDVAPCAHFQKLDVGIKHFL